MAPDRSPAGSRPRSFSSATASLSSRPLTVVLSLRVPPVRPRGVHVRSRRLHPRGVALRRGQRLQGLVGRGQLHGGPPHLRGQQLPVPHGPLHPSALDVRRRRRLPGRLGRRPPILRYASTRLHPRGGVSSSGLRPGVSEGSQCNGFLCSNHTCLPATAHCNGIQECPDGADEQNCGERGLVSDEALAKT